MGQAKVSLNKTSSSIDLKRRTESFKGSPQTDSTKPYKRASTQDKEPKVVWTREKMFQLLAQAKLMKQDAPELFRRFSERVRELG